MKNSEKRINKRLLTYWNNLKKSSNDIPYEDSINPEEIEDLWSNCFVINANSHKYSYMGKNIIAIQEGKSVIGKDVYATLICQNDSNVASIINEVVSSKAPLTQDSQFENRYGVTIKYRRCFLPLADESGNVSYILGGIRWKTH